MKMEATPAVPVRPPGLGVVRGLAIFIAVTITVYSYLLYPAAAVFGSAVAGGRGEHFDWAQLTLVSLPAILAAVALALGARNLRKRRRHGVILMLAAYVWLMSLDALVHVLHPRLSGHMRYDGMRVHGLGRNAWEYLDSIYFSAVITFTIFALLAVGLAAWYRRPVVRRWLAGDSESTNEK